MHLHNSSTSSSELGIGLSASSSKLRTNSSASNSKLRAGSSIYNFVVTALWFLFSLVVFDVSINFLFPYPSDPHNLSPGKLNFYFELGRSIEGKLSRIVGPTDKSTAPIGLAGWLETEAQQDLPTKPTAGEDMLVAIYGMSFSNYIGQAMKAIDPKVALRSISAPDAPPNHSFAAYTLDRGKHQADVVVLGILASSVKGLGAMNSMTWRFEWPTPYTYPRYFVEDEKLKAVWPEVRSLTQFRTVMQDEQQWDAFVNQMREQDRCFNSFMFEGNLLDGSVVGRLIRRAWGQSHQARIENHVHGRTGFNTKSEEITVLRSMVTEFATTAKRDGKLPIVLLINNLGYEDHLFQVLKPTLENSSIPFVSTHNIAPATDKKNFIADGHFTKSVDKLIAKDLLKLLDEHFTKAKLQSAVTQRENVDRRDPRTQ